MKKWIILEKDGESFSKWSNEFDQSSYYFLIISDKNISCSNDIGELPSDSVLVLNRDYIVSINNEFSKELTKIAANARLWVHLGGIPREPTREEWCANYSELPGSPGLPDPLKTALESIEDKRAFGSYYNSHVYSDVADKVSTALQKKKCLQESGCDLLETAWKKAAFILERSVQQVIEALFPFYVDLSNHHSSNLETADLEASWKAAKLEVNIVLSRWGYSKRAEFRDKLGELIKDDSANTKNRLLCQTSINLLEALDGQVSGIDEKDDEKEKFREYFRKLSEAYTYYLDLDREADPATIITSATK